LTRRSTISRRTFLRCPKGIDIFFDNVGGDVLDAALARLAMRGRVVLCGGIENYNATEPRRR
jgi:NADPH-dependent curcumin reductase CurA